jgi:hypothetical protein
MNRRHASSHDPQPGSADFSPQRSEASASLQRPSAIKHRAALALALAVIACFIVASLLFWPSEPYRFLEEARLDDLRVSTEPTMTMSMGLTTFREMCVRHYFVPDTGPDMAKELEADGWQPLLNFDEPYRTTCWVRSGRTEYISLTPVKHSGGFVTIVTLPNTADRAQAWIWKLSHRQ